jgi:hypothetical protein
VQEAHNTAGTEGEASFRRGRSWFATAALVLVAAVGVIAATIIFTLDSGAPDAPPTRSDSGAGAPTLTDEEAIDRYLELEEFVVQAYHDVDATLLPLIYTSDSPTAGLVRKELRDLREDSAKLVLTYQTEEIEVLSNSRDEIILRQELIVKARLRPVGDVKVRARYHDLRRVVRSVLRYQEPNGWLIHSATAIDSERVEK